MVTLGQIAEEIGADLSGHPDTEIVGVGTLLGAQAGDLSFLANPQYRKHLGETRATAVVLAPEMAEFCPVDSLVCDNPYVGYARAAVHFDRAQNFEPAIHPTAVVADDAQLGEHLYLGPHTVVESGSNIGAGSFIGAGSVIGANSKLGNQCLLHARVTLCHDVVIGDRVIVHPGAVIGSDGFGIANDKGQRCKVPQLGGVRIGSDCEIGANTTIDRGTISDTVLEDDVRLDNQIHIAHNTFIGAHTAMAGQSATAGSARIGRYCMIGGNAGILGHLEIADRVTITAKSLVTHSIREPGEYSSGTPLQENKLWRRNAVRIRQLDDLARRLRKIEKDND